MESNKSPGNTQPCKNIEEDTTEIEKDGQSSMTGILITKDDITDKESRTEEQTAKGEINVSECYKNETVCSTEVQERQSIEQLDEMKELAGVRDDFGNVDTETLQTIVEEENHTVNTVEELDTCVNDNTWETSTYREHHKAEESPEFDEGYGSPIAVVRPDEDELEMEYSNMNKGNIYEEMRQNQVKTCKEKCRRNKKYASSLVTIKKPLKFASDSDDEDSAESRELKQKNQKNCESNRSNNTEVWRRDHSLPAGWKVRKTGGLLEYLSPGGKLFRSRMSALLHAHRAR